MGFLGVIGTCKGNMDTPYPLNIPSPFGVLMAVWHGNSKRSINRTTHPIRTK